MSGRLTVNGFLVSDLSSTPFRKGVTGSSIAKSAMGLSILDKASQEFLAERLRTTTGRELRENLSMQLANLGQLFCDSYTFAVQSFHGTDTLLAEVPRFFVTSGAKKESLPAPFKNHYDGSFRGRRFQVQSSAVRTTFGLSLGFADDRTSGGVGVEVAYQREFGRTTGGKTHIRSKKNAMVIPLYGTGHQIASGAVNAPEGMREVWQSLPAKYRYSAASTSLLSKSFGEGMRAYKFLEQQKDAKGRGIGRWVQQTTGSPYVKAIFVADTERLYAVGEKGVGEFSIWGGGHVFDNKSAGTSMTTVANGGSVDNDLVDSSGSAVEAYGSGVDQSDLAALTETSGSGSVFSGGSFLPSNVRKMTVGDEFSNVTPEDAQIWLEGFLADPHEGVSTGDIEFLRGVVDSSGNKHNIRRTEASKLKRGSVVHKLRMLQAINLRASGGVMGNLRHETTPSTGFLPSDSDVSFRVDDPLKGEGGFMKGLGSKMEDRSLESLGKKYQGSTALGKNAKLPMGIKNGRKDIIRAAGVSVGVNAFHFGHPVHSDGGDKLNDYLHEGNANQRSFLNNSAPTYDRVLRDIGKRSDRETSFLMTSYGVTAVSGFRGSSNWQDTALANTFSIQGNNNNIVNKHDRRRVGNAYRLASRIGYRNYGKANTVTVLKGASLTTGDVNTSSYAKHMSKASRRHAQLLESQKQADMPIGIIDSADTIAKSLNDPAAGRYTMGGIRRYTPLFAAVSRVRVGDANGHMQNVIKNVGSDEGLEINYDDLIPKTKSGQLDKRFTARPTGGKIVINRNNILSSWRKGMTEK